MAAAKTGVSSVFLKIRGAAADVQISLNDDSSEAGSLAA